VAFAWYVNPGMPAGRKTGEEQPVWSAPRRLPPARKAIASAERETIVIGLSLFCLGTVTVSSSAGQRTFARSYRLVSLERAVLGDRPMSQQSCLIHHRRDRS
jgi:hypothetical protein